jgi:hypothetical protein
MVVLQPVMASQPALAHLLRQMVAQGMTLALVLPSWTRLGRLTRFLALVLSGHWTSRVTIFE